MTPKLAAVALAAALLCGFGASATSADSETVTLLEPLDGTRVATSLPTFTGTGASGAQVVVSDLRGTELCTAAVEQREWSCKSGIEMGVGDTGAIAHQSSAAGTSSASVAFRVVSVPADPLDEWLRVTIAAFAFVAIVAALAVLLVRRSARRPRTGVPREHASGYRNRRLVAVATSRGADLRGT